MTSNDAGSSASRLRTPSRVALANGTIIALPAAPGPAYPSDLTGPPKDAVRAGTLAVTSPAGLAGAPQITVRGSTVEGKPVGLGLLAARGMDEALLAMAAAVDDR